MKKSSILKISGSFLVLISFIILGSDGNSDSGGLGVFLFFLSVATFVAAFNVGNAEDAERFRSMAEAHRAREYENREEDEKRRHRKWLVSVGVCEKCKTKTLSVEHKKDTRRTKTVLNRRKDGSFVVGSETDGFLLIYYKCSNCKNWYDGYGHPTTMPIG